MTALKKIIIMGTALLGVALLPKVIIPNRTQIDKNTYQIENKNSITTIKRSNIIHRFYIDKDKDGTIDEDYLTVPLRGCYLRLDLNK